VTFCLEVLVTLASWVINKNSRMLMTEAWRRSSSVACCTGGRDPGLPNTREDTLWLRSKEHKGEPLKGQPWNTSSNTREEHTEDMQGEQCLHTHENGRIYVRYLLLRRNTKAKISLTNEKTPKQWRTRMKHRSHKGEGTNRKGRVKQGSKEGEDGQVLSTQEWTQNV
jgi:hypothetical protein